MLRRHAALKAAVLVYALGLLSIGISRDWRLTHEDNGAIYSTMALSHLRLGLAETKAHDVLYNPHDQTKYFYGHHPPGLALSLAAAFYLFDSEAPWTARLVPIFFHLGSIALAMALVGLWFSPAVVILTGFWMATVPMGSFFGRMVGYEPLGLFAVMVQLLAYSSYLRGGGRRRLAVLSGGVLLGGLIDWPPLYFSLSLFGCEALRCLKQKRLSAALLVLGASGLAVFTFDIWHLSYSGGSLAHLRAVVSQDHLVPENLTAARFVLRNFELGRRYYSHASLLAALALAAALCSRRGRLSALVPAAPDLAAIMACCLAAGGTYLVCIAQYSLSHHYSQFYLFPFYLLATATLAEKILAAKPAWLGAIVLIEVLATSAYGLYLRHGTAPAFVAQVVAEHRAKYLAPR